jgi:hypothetical protein
MWVVELLLVLSDSKTIFQYVPEFYVESLVGLLFHLAFCFFPFTMSTFTQEDLLFIIFAG